MMKKLHLAFTLLLVLSITATARPVEHYIRFQISDRSQLGELSRVVSISDVRGNDVFAYANQEELNAFKKLGYEYLSLRHPGTLIVPEMAPSLDAVADWDTYPSYDQYESMMYQFEIDYPALCQIHNVGYSVLGHKILFAKISANVAASENEPEVMYTSTMHGDETTGYVLMLRLIDSLLTGYGADSRVTDMVDNMEIWINPLANPDGTYATGDESVSGATRYNANSVDLNRNFPDPDNGDHPDGREWQPETIAMMDFAAAHNFVIAGNFHGGAEVINYPWDTWSHLHADDDWYRWVSRDYADTAQVYGPHNYMTDQEDGITNGYDWYPIAGGRQDYMNYWHGCREVTVELSKVKLANASTLPDYWEWNKIALLDYLEKARCGIRGVVIDAVSRLPVAATVTVIGHDIDNSQVYADPGGGDYYRMIATGTYDLEFTAEGYFAHTVLGVSVIENDVDIVNVSLVPESGGYVCGDIDNTNYSVDIQDIDYFIEFLYQGGPVIAIPPAADADGSGQVDAADIDYLIDYLFQGGPSPACDFGG